VRRGLGALVCGAVVFASGSGSRLDHGAAAASPGRESRGLVVSLRAPAGCPSLGALRELVAEHLGHAGRGGPRLRVHVAVRKAGDERWVARLDVRGAAGGRRDLEGGSCREVIDAAALVIALAVEDEGQVASQALPLVLEGEPELGGDALGGEREGRVTGADDQAARRVDIAAEAEPVEQVEPVDQAEYDFDAGPAGGPVAAVHTRLAARAGGAGAAGVLPGATAGFDLAVSGWRERNGLELSASFFAETATRQNGSGVRVGMWTSGLRGCRTFGPAAACGGGELGRMIGHGMYVPRPRKAGALWGAVSGSLWFRRHLGGAAAIYAGLEGILPITRPRFTVGDDPLVYQPGAVGARALIGLELSTR
jgi:hypothetical protein